MRLYQCEEHNRFTLNQTKGQFKMWGRDEDVEERQWNITVTVNQCGYISAKNITDLHSTRKKDSSRRGERMRMRKKGSGT